MKAFEYANPNSVDDALSLLDSSWGKTAVLAGGTDLITSLKQNIAQPSRLVSLKNIASLSGISTADGALRVGATTTLSEFIGNSDANKHFPALVTAAKNLSSAQILNKGTVGGELLQRPRCWYYRQGFGLLAMDGGKSLVPEGDNRYHAVFGNKGPAYFVNPSSLAPGLIALDATLTLRGSGGSREVKAADFFTTPKKDTDRENVLKANEILEAISIPMKGLKNGTYEIRPRAGLDWPMVTASVAFKQSGSSASDSRVVLGHVAPVPWQSEAASKALNGTAVKDEKALEAVGEAAAKGASPLSGNGYKVHQIKTAVIRAIAASA